VNWATWWTWLDYVMPSWWKSQLTRPDLKDYQWGICAPFCRPPARPLLLGYNLLLAFGGQTFSCHKKKKERKGGVTEGEWQGGFWRGLTEFLCSRTHLKTRSLREGNPKMYCCSPRLLAATKRERILSRRRWERVLSPSWPPLSLASLSNSPASPILLSHAKFID